MNLQNNTLKRSCALIATFLVNFFCLKSRILLSDKAKKSNNREQMKEIAAEYTIWGS